MPTTGNPYLSQMMQSNAQRQQTGYLAGIGTTRRSMGPSTQDRLSGIAEWSNRYIAPFSPGNTINLMTGGTANWGMDKSMSAMGLKQYGPGSDNVHVQGLYNSVGPGTTGKESPYGRDDSPYGGVTKRMAWGSVNRW